MLPGIKAPPIRVVVRIPGVPFAQPTIRKAFNPVTKETHIHSNPKAVTWRKYAQDYMREALERGGMKMPAFPDGPLDVTVRAVWPCPRSRHLKRSIRPAEWRDKRPDASNVQKALEDAATGIMWTDDSQVARFKIEKVTAEQGIPAVLVIEVALLLDEPPRL
jgi:Holliday junction resolvase RusA-like endonuclease